MSVLEREDGGGVEALVRTGDLLCERYRAETLLGEGAHAQVWQALDHVTSQRVAVKLLLRGVAIDRARVRREVAALRVLRTPGVAKLLDEGTHHGQTFVVMDLVPGVPFPGHAGAVTWEQLAPAALSLLETLERVHALGVVHCDLKPSNVLVRADGRAVLLDFGIADLPHNRWTELAPGGGWMGTPAYLAPEVLLGERPNQASDLYAVGVMLYEALSGVRPHRDATGTSLRERLQGPPPLSTRVATISRELESAVHAMLSPEAQDRPASAREASESLRALHHDRSGPAWARLEGSKTFADVLKLFAGRDRLSHAREDAAALLMTIAAGDGARMEALLGGWSRAGLVRWDGHAFALLADVETLRASVGEAPTRTRGLAARLMDAASTIEDLVTGSLDAARDAVDAGLHTDAKNILAQAAREARLQEDRRAPLDVSVLTTLFSTWIEIAVLDMTPTDVDVLLYELHHANRRWQGLASLAELAQAALDIHHDPPRAAKRLGALPAFRAERLERLRAALRMVAARSESVERERATLDEIIAWSAGCTEDDTAGRVLGWRGRLDYRLNRFESAAELHQASAARLTRPFERAAAELNAASAWVEACDFERAIERCDAAARAMGARRSPLLALRLEWLQRLARYRGAGEVVPDPELVEAAEGAGLPGYCAPLLLLEAAIHLRRDTRTEGAVFARRAADIWRALRALPDFVTLCGCLELACEDALDEERAAQLCKASSEITTFGVELQALGLLGMAGYVLPEEARERAARLFEAIPVNKRDVRLDIVSPRESIQAIDRSC